MKMTRFGSTETMAPIFCRIAMRSMISASIAAFRSSVTPLARVAESRTCSVAPTLGYGSSIDAPFRPSGAVRWMPLTCLSTTAPMARRASRWKSIGRSPMRQPPRSGMNASPSLCSSGPQNRIGMRLEPACASISAKCADSTRDGSRMSSPRAGSVMRTPCTSSSPRTTLTSEMSGTSRRIDGVSPSSDATMALVARFFAPRTSMRPTSGLPPRMTISSDLRPTRAPAAAASCTREFTTSPAMSSAANWSGGIRTP